MTAGQRLKSGGKRHKLILEQQERMLAKRSSLSLIAVLAVGLTLSIGAMSVAHAATFTVNSTTDAVDAAPGDGVCATAAGACTLRAAIQEANALAGADTIMLPPGTYILSIAGAGEDAAATGDLDITGNLTMTGAGAASTIVDGNGLDRVFEIRPGANVTITSVTIRNGQGGGILINSTATLTLTSSTVSDNRTDILGGGGILNAGTAILTDVTLSGNTADAGGGILNGGSMTLTNVTISGNTARSTLGGGGIFHSGSSILLNVTISNNSAAVGGGISAPFAPPPPIPVQLKNTIVANNPSGGDCAVFAVIMSLGHNLESDGSCSLTGPGDLTNIDPVLGPLQDNGGPTFTHALLPGSPAINAGSPDCPPPNTDQRGVTRPQGVACDIGAYEAVSCRGTGPFRLWGRVKTAESPKGIRGVTLALTGPNDCTDTATTRVLGLYRFPNLSDGTYTLTPSKTGCTFTPPSQTVTIAGSNAKANFSGTCP